MRYSVVVILGIVFALQAAFRGEVEPVPPPIDSIAALYRQPLSKWPQPTIDSGVKWQEFASLPGVDSSYFTLMEQPDVKLGKLLFFDPLLSGSNQISCSSCHDPQLSWTDKRSVALGHDHQQGSRNTLSLLNVAARKSLFWDGRSLTLESQAFSPISAHHEMAADPAELGAELGAIAGYRQLFADAYGDESVTFDRIVEALGAFQRTITSRRSRFDRFLDGEYDRMTNQEIYGMHLFRTKARCMNCHHGQQLTDEGFHNIGLTYYKRKYEDLGRYLVTNDSEDVGKFRTPSLRDVMHTNPWMHNGLFDNITGVLNMYNSGMQMNTATPEQKEADPLYPVTDPLMKKLNLTKEEIAALETFLEAITATQYKMRRPETLPR